MGRGRLDQGRIATKRALRVSLNAIQRIYAVRWTQELGRRQSPRQRLICVSTMLAFLAATSLPSMAADLPAAMPFTVLVFSKTTGFRHESIPDGIAAIEALGIEQGFAVEATEDSGHFTNAVLSRFKAVVFLSTTGDVLDENQKAAFERYIRSGGGYVGIHSAADTEYGWSWYGRLVGAYFESHPAIQRGRVHVVDREHPATRSLPEVWQRTDEWYNFKKNPRGRVHVLATVDEQSYTGGTMGADHPIAWCQNFDGGRSWYTAMGHTAESYSDHLFRRHLWGGIQSAAGVSRTSCAAE
jgi:cytochrome c